MPTVRSHDEMLWHNDGHSIILSIKKSELEVLQTNCPHEEEDGPCYSDVGCIVQYFIHRFGMECNIGVCPPEPTLEICWALAGEPRDPDAAQLWFVPVNDEVFYAWMVTQKEPQPDGPASDQ
jgi:hypothetical protein